MNKDSKLIVFILPSIDAPHILKRVEEFTERGYNVKVYGFKHCMETTLNIPRNFDIEIVGTIEHFSYLKRIPTIIKGLKKVICSCKGKNVVYYLPSLDVAMFHLLVCRAPYIYEESDLKHTYVKSPFIQWILESISKRIIKKSQVSAFTSAGFLNFHFGDKWPNNTCLVPNKLRRSIMDLPAIEKCPIDINHIRFAFVGKSQFKSVYKFAEQLVSGYPQHEMHFWGTVDECDRDVINRIDKYSNCFFHGRFSNPTDLVSIYSRIDILVSIFDLEPENWLYAEPNKLYDSIYFRTPILVAKGTFLEKRVLELGIGYSIDIETETVKEFLISLNRENLQWKIDNLVKIPQSYAVNDNSVLFSMLDNIKQPDKF